ncbi:E3 ubiquitin protein ligase RIN2 [Auxenochlorella protothecoides]|uniref:E3 ubiquitin protein ligase RIN2 n=1 Tax=Auxenochlorella protothecoides TaxID=3075 RepID=A0A087SFP9_AUXPR|nr:E3 ubiquitin protein ligase RIN2 [Auxenochlorella protothecoides]KFM24553.1 E3 ubiquitin protein ligase RIN2 [Auxenochlorella protothecoides]
MPPELASRQAVQPWMIIMSVFLASGSGLWYQLGTIGGGAGQQSASLAADTLSRAWQEGTDPGVAFDEARARSSEVLEDVLQSQLGLFFLCSLFLSTYALGALVTKALFLGQLTILETTKLAERMLKFVMLKVVFLGAVVDPEPHELGTWLLWFSVMAFFRAFVGLARDRCEALLSSPRATPLQHARCLVLLVGILGQAGSWVASYAAAADPSRPSAALSHALLWLFDAVCVAIEAAHAVLKYGVHAVERWKAQRAEAAGADPATGWEGRGPFLYHVEVGVDLVLHALTLGHYCHLWWLHGFRLQLIDAVLFLDVRYLVMGTLRRVRGYARYRRLTHQLQHSFPPLPRRSGSASSSTERGGGEGTGGDSGGGASAGVALAGRGPHCSPASSALRPGAGLGEGAALSANAPHTLTEQLATASFRSLSATFSTNSVAQRGASHSQHPHEQEEVASPAPSSMSCRLSGARHRYGTRSQSAAPQ